MAMTSFRENVFKRKKTEPGEPQRYSSARLYKSVYKGDPSRDYDGHETNKKRITRALLSNNFLHHKDIAEMLGTDSTIVGEIAVKLGLGSSGRNRVSVYDDFAKCKYIAPIWGIKVHYAYERYKRYHPSERLLTLINGGTFFDNDRIIGAA